jgi:hypothetical protein
MRCSWKNLFADMLFPSRGGFKLDLLDGNDQLLRELTPPGAYEGEADPTVSTCDELILVWISCLLLR